MLYTKIYNPVSGKKVNITSKLGKQIINKYRTLLLHMGGAGAVPMEVTEHGADPEVTEHVADPMEVTEHVADPMEDTLVVRIVSVPGQNINFDGLNRDVVHPLDCFGGTLFTAGLITNEVYLWLSDISRGNGISWNNMFDGSVLGQNTGGEIGYEFRIAEPRYNTLSVLRNFIPKRNNTYVLTVLQLKPININQETINHVVLVKNNPTEGLTLIDSQRERGNRIFQGDENVIRYLYEVVYSYGTNVTGIFIIKERIGLEKIMGEASIKGGR